MREAFAIYARCAVRSAGEIDRQVQVSRAAGLALGLTEGPVYVDDGQSGMHGACPSRLAMLQAASRGEFGHLFIHDLHRLGRDPQTLVLLLGTLNAAGVHIHTLEGPAGVEEMIGHEAAHCLEHLLSTAEPSLEVQIARCRAIAARLGFNLVALRIEHPGLAS